ncbi:hypothetical protein GCM10010994_55190 [Chelatococcus reniformis]|uniref:PepSY domain-containing protein n=1 Tax=Chelatococcus reniformis TaxID=1494448 RepID=A0A916UVB6_9HYPH|nr:hypothetical protein GCM10010994_55190 [Chelatococcus reniformis]
MRLRYIVLALACIAPGAAGAAEKLPSFPKRTLYDDAKSSLIALGFKPADMTSVKGRCLDDQDTRCAHYPEIEICYPTGKAQCQLLWTTPSGKVIEIETTEDLKVIGSKCRANCS